MNKPIKLTQEITDLNSLLNKFLLYKYEDGSSFMYYIYKTNNSNDILAYEVLCYNKRLVFHSYIWPSSLYIINSNIHNAIINDCYIYII